MNSGWNMPPGVFSTPYDVELRCCQCGCTIDEDDDSAEYDIFGELYCEDCFGELMSDISDEEDEQ